MAEATASANAPMSVSDILKNQDKFAKDLTEQFATILKGIKEGSDAKQATADTQREIGQQNAVITQQKMAADMQATNDTREAALAMGRMPGASNYLVTSLSAEILKKEEEVRSRDADIQGKMDQSFFDNPLQFIYNQYSLPFDVTARNQVATQTEAMNKQLAESAKRLTESAQSNEQIKQVITTETIAAATRKNLLEAELLARNAEYEKSALQIHGATVLEAMNKDQFQAVLSTQAAAQEVVRLQLSKEAAGRDAARLGMEQQKFQIQLRNDAREEAGRVAIQGKLDKVSRSFGLPPVTLDEYNHLPASRKEMYGALMMQTELSPAVASYGATPAAAVATIERFNIPIKNIEMQRLVDKVKTVRAIFMNDKVSGFDKLDENEKQVKINSAVGTAIKEEAKNIPATGGYLSPLPLASIMQAPMVQQTPLGQRLMALAVSDPNRPTNAQDIYAAAVGMIVDSNGAMSTREAAEQVAFFWKSADSLTYDTRQYAKFMLDVPNTHKAAVTVGSFLGGPAVIDVRNAVAVEALLIRDVPRVKKRNAEREYAEIPRAEPLF
jgi:hypothetical protein